MKPTVLDGSACRRNHFKIALTLLLSLFLSLTLLTSLSLSADDQASKAVRRSTSDQRRVALVIGNSDYKDMPLRNPAHDADDIAKVLRELGFTVQTKMNANQREMEDAVKEFVRQIQNGDVGLFYFSGHGVQVSGENYLIPVAGSIETETDCRYKAVNAGLILGRMEESRNRTNIFILDACRNNPFKGFRSLNKGLTMMDAPVGTFIAYATAPGSVAADGTDRNSPYAKHLMQAMKSRGIKIEDVFKQVLREVTRETDGKQVPWIASSLREDFYFKPGESPTHAPTTITVTGGPIPRESSPAIHTSAIPTGPPVPESAHDYRSRAEQLVAQFHNLGNWGAGAVARDKLNLMCKEPDAVKWFIQAGQRGDPLAQFVLGRMFRDGVGVPKDYAKAVKWFKKAAEQGYVPALNGLGQMHLNGWGVPKDYVEAAKWFRKGAERGNSFCQTNLGDMYCNGYGVSRDQKEALKWYKRAGEQGNAYGQYRLGLMYNRGQGVQKNQKEAIKWYKKAADQGNEYAIRELRKMGATSSR